MPYTPPSNPSPQLRTVLRWYEAVTSWDFETLDKIFSDDYVHVSLPASVKEADKNKTEGLAHAKVMSGLFEGKPLKVSVPTAPAPDAAA